MIENQSIYLALSVVLFIIGAAGAVCRRNAIVVFMCIEIMLGGVSIAFVTFSRAHQSLDGIFMVLFVMAVAAAEAAVGLAIFVLMYRKHGSIDLDKFNLLKW
ncbi:MAG: NADH-quinone oxidoreductase subunit NuoK [Deltaproteobacteria bacterium]|jgi:NADH-quinone oxidoreductase subunit K|nr:NADH-quinone oxidoreductase subunit NuoK [Candidatus Tharpella sp.]